MTDLRDRIHDLSPEKRALLALRLQRMRAEQAAASTIPPRPSGERIPLSFGQQQIWLLTQLMPDRPVYNECVTIRLTGPLDVPAFVRSFNEVLRRHEAWRTTFDSVDGEPVQVIQPPPTLTLPVIDLAALPESLREVEALRLATEDARIPFDFVRGPLFRTRLVRLSPTDHRLFLTLHHIIFDGVSIYDVLLPELAALYQAYITGAPVSLPALPVQYPDYAFWQRQHVTGDVLAAHIDYWRRQLSDGDLPVLQLPTDHPRPAEQSSRGALQRFALSRTRTDALKDLCRREGVTLYMGLVAVLVTLLHRYAGQDDIALGTVTGSRDRIETEKLMGFFLNTLVLRADLRGDPTVRELLQRVRRTVLEAQAHRDVPFALLVQELQPERNLAQNPLFGVLFTFEPPLAPLDLPWQMSQLDIDVGTAKFDLSIELDERPEGIIGRFEYSTDLFEAAAITRMMGHFQTLIDAMVAAPDARLSALPLLTEAERAQVLVAWNATSREYPDTECIHQLFEAQAAHAPDRLAVVCEEEQLSYGALNARANRLAHHLRALGVRQDVPVGLCVERSADILIGMLGILKAGGAYVPLDPSYPAQRLAFMLADAAAPVIVTQSHLAGRLPAHEAAVVVLDAEDSPRAQEEERNPVAITTPDDLAYIIYTSGSTGVPKGVQVSHRSVVNFIASMTHELQLTDREICLALTPISFDIAVLELLLPLAIGARTVIASRAVARDGARLAALQRAAGATLVQATPATWQLLLGAGWQGDPHMKVLCGGEALSPDLAGRLRERAATLWNLYGPTETTIWSTMQRVETACAPVPIGRPIANTRVYVLDPFGQPVPVGVPGELYIGGVGVARGYLRRPDLTAERFIPDPFGPSESRLYRTGDRVHWLPDGTLEYLGRLDHQVKVRGFRIELGEIESVLLRHPGVREAVVVARETPGGDARLVAYIVPTGAPPHAGVLRPFLQEALPDYMVPATYVALDALPLTPNGKVDRAALPPPDTTSVQPTTGFMPPRSLLERELVALWEDVLGVHPIGIQDNFFDLGGHSLLAVQLFARLEARLGVRLPVATLFHAPTIAQLGDFVQEGASQRFSSLVPIQPQGVHPPLFCVHGFGGNVLVFRDLAQQLRGYEQPLYGLQAREVDGVHAPFTDIETMATHYLAEMRVVQPEGPYYLAGYSGGALIAFEMARQLQSSGEAVGLLVMLDGTTPDYIDITLNPAFVGRFLANLPRAVSAFLKLGPREMLSRLAMHRRVLGKVLRARLVAKLRHLDGDVPRTDVEYLLDVASQLPPEVRQYTDLRQQAVLAYTPQVYPGRITVLRATAQPVFCSHDLELGWGSLAGEGVEIVFAPGKHHTLLRMPYVTTVARTLAAVLARARESQATEASAG